MSEVPEDAKTFFTQYLPSRFELTKSAFAGKTSNGSMVFRVVDGGEWSLRLQAGELEIADGMHDDAILQVTVSAEDFKPIFVRGAELQEGVTIKPEQQVMAFKALVLDAERAKMVRSMGGTVAFVIADGGRTHRLAVTPGGGAPKLEQPDCRLECNMNDFMEMQTGKQLPMQLAMAGKIRIVGNAQISMALAGVFG